MSPPLNPLASPFQPQTSQNGIQADSFSDQKPITYSFELLPPSREGMRSMFQTREQVPHEVCQQILGRSRHTRVMDITEAGTGAILLRNVQKDLLRLFLGVTVVQTFLRKRGHRQQLFEVPEKSTSEEALQILISWMRRACSKRPQDVRDLAVPEDLFIAISLANTLRLFNLHIDADRFDDIIVRERYPRALRVDTVKSIWNRVPRDSIYTYEIIVLLKERLVMREFGDAFDAVFAIIQYLGEEPELWARVYEKGSNEKFNQGGDEKGGHGRNPHQQPEALQSKATRTVRFADEVTVRYF